MGIEDYEDITPAVAERLVAKAREGDSGAALRVLELFVCKVRGGEALPLILLEYLAESFERLLDEVESKPAERARAAAKALNLTGPARHRPRTQGIDERDLALALGIHSLVVKGHTPEQAITRLSGQSPRFSEVVISRAWRKYKDSPELRDLLQDPVPQGSG